MRIIFNSLLAAVGAISLSVVVSSPALAQSSAQLRHWCFSVEATDDQTIMGCSSIIDADHKAEKNMNRIATAYTNRGLSYANKEQYDMALRDYAEAIRINPDDPITYNNSGIAHRHVDQYDKAIDDYTKAIQIRPDYADALYNRGIAYDDMEKYDLAIQDYDEAARLNPRDASIFLNRGVSYTNKGDYARAVQDYDEAIRLKPDYQLAITNRAAIAAKVGHQ